MNKTVHNLTSIFIMQFNTKTNGMFSVVMKNGDKNTTSHFADNTKYALFLYYQ